MKKISQWLRWIGTAALAVCLIGNGVHWSGLFIVGALLLIIPVPAIQNTLSKTNLKGIWCTGLALVLLIVAVATSPASAKQSAKKSAPTKTTASFVDTDTAMTSGTLKTTTTTVPSTSAATSTTQKSTTAAITTTATTASTTTTTTQKPTTTTTQITTTTTVEEESTMVWIPKSGKKYHSYAGCSGMKDPSEVTLEEAEEMGYTPCKRCH